MKPTKCAIGIESQAHAKGPKVVVLPYVWEEEVSDSVSIVIGEEAFSVPDDK